MLKKTKIFILGLLFICALSIIIPFASASTVTIYNSIENNYNIPILKAIHPSSDAYMSGAAASFIATNTGYITSVNTNVFCSYGTLASAELVMTLQGVDNSIASNTATPNATVYATSNTITIINLDSYKRTITFTFNGTYQLVASSTYSICITTVDISSERSGYYVGFVFELANHANDTPAAYHNNGWFTYLETSALGFTVYGSTTVDPTPTPTPPPTATATPTDGITNVITALTSNILTFIALALILIPAVIGAKFAGGWGFLAGLNIGVGLVFILNVITGSLWFVVMIGIVDAVAIVRGMSGSGKTETVTKGE